MDFSTNFIAFILFVTVIGEGHTNDIEELSSLTDRSLGFDIHIPVLFCHVKHTGYNIVTWYKDGMVVKNSSADRSGHVLSVANILHNPTYEVIDNVLKLQGYYWCETDYPLEYRHSSKYLFQIEGINTYSCSLVATEDSFGNETKLSLEEKISKKLKIYEFELQDVLFGFLPKPSVFATNITISAKGLETHFFLYAWKAFSPRVSVSHLFSEDRHQLQFIEDYLNNITTTDATLYYNILEWLEFRGINLEDIVIRSTVGCHADRTLIVQESPREINWPNAFIGDIVIPEESCSTKNGLAVSRICTGSFDNGATWGPVTGICSNEPSKLTVQLKTLFQNLSQKNGPNPAQRLRELTATSKLLSVNDLHIAATILEELIATPKFDQSNTDDVFTSINHLLEANSSILDAVKNNLRFTNRILEIIETAMTLAAEQNKEIKISKPLLLAGSTGTQAGETHINGAAISSETTSLQNNSITFLTNGSGFSFYTSPAGFLLPTELILKRESELDIPCKISVVFFKDNRLFTSGATESISTSVIQVSLSGGPAWNLTNPVQLYFKDEHQLHTLEDPVCVYFDTQLNESFGDWSTEGCWYTGIKNGYYQCQCHHLSTFSIVFSQRKGGGSTFKLHISVYVGCGISIIALAFAVLLYLVSKNWRATVDQNVLFCLSLTLLASVIIILVNDVHILQWKPGCMLVATIFFYLVLSTFCWLFVQAIVYQLRFSKKTEIGDLCCFLSQAMVFACGVPFVVVGIIWITRKSVNYGHENCWPTVVEVSNVASIPVVIVLFLTMCINASAAYSISCGYKKDFLIGFKGYSEAVFKFRIAISIFGLFVLSWIFGYLSLHYKPHELQILFSICLIVTSYYISLFFIFHEISLWDIFAKLRRKKQSSVPKVENAVVDNKPY